MGAGGEARGATPAAEHAADPPADAGQSVAVSAGAAHPLGVKPSGNELVLPPAARLGLGGLGPWLGALSEERLMDLLGLLEPRDLAALACASQAAFVYASDDALWREAALGTWRANAPFAFHCDWRSSALEIEQRGCSRFVPTRSLCSDLLFRPWQYATAELRPEWLEREEVPVRDAKSLSVDQFIEEFERPCKPVLIRGALRDSWPVFGRWGDSADPARPKRPMLKSLEGVTTPFRVGPVDMRLCDFLDYAERQQEESPLYLFDCKFDARSGCSAEDLYQVPIYFRNTASHPDRDLFESMGSKRPDYRWLIAGAARSGSKWHIDPNTTHAWNGVVSGKKRWLMCPPGCPPPGVTPSPDGAEVTQPVSLIEWFVNFYRLQQLPIEFTAEAGDLVFVPSGWWHCVLNIEPCVAITQNYVSVSNMGKALRMMRDSPELVSGIPCERPRESLFTDFCAGLAAHHVKLLKDFEDCEQERKRRRIVKPEDSRDFKFSFF